jgi:class 3 adenylate cyclase/predicted ATPase
MRDVTEWLRQLGLEQYAPAFRENGIDGSVLPDLTAEDLKELGVSLVGHRLQLLKAIGVLRPEPTPAAGPPAVPSTSPAALPDDHRSPGTGAERRHLTVMFCDLVGSTALGARLDVEDLHEIIGAYHECVAAVIDRYDGFVAKYMGDDVLVYFGYPRAHEDDAERAVRSGLTLIAAVGQLQAPEPLRVRIGIDTGPVVVGDLFGSGEAQEHDIVGETPNLAARLQALGEPNTIVVGPRTRGLLGNLFELRDLGPIEVKGFAERVHAYQVLRPSAIESRFEALQTGSSLTPLISREEELDLLLRRWQRATNGEGQMVLLSGEPGIGKSRLTVALQERLQAQPYTCLRYFCSLHRQHSALHPVISRLERAAGFEREGALEMKRDKLEALLAPASPSQEDVALLSELLSLPASDRYPRLDLTPQRRKEKTFDALLRQLEGLARQQPVLMIFEDVQWIDATSQELLDLTVARVTRWPVLLLITCRPEYTPPWTGQPQVTVLTLNHFDRRASAALVRHVVGDATLSSDVVEEIIERTDGVPLFIEELTKAVLEAGQGTAKSTLSTTAPTALAVPPTLHASLMARLDRLGPAAKEVAQIGAAIGREFSYELLIAATNQTAGELHAALDRLADAGLIFRRGMPPDAAYTFKHALVQDAAYGTLLRGARQQLHTRIAAALGERFPEIAQTQPEVLARHCTEAGLADAAVVHWRNAGGQAVRRAANREAIEHFRRALSLNEGRPDGIDRRRSELAILSQLGPMLMSFHGWAAPEVGAAVERAGELARHLESSADLAPPLVGLWVFHLTRGQFARAGEVSGELFRIARELDDPEILLQAHHSAWPIRFLRGVPAEACEHIDAGLALYDERRHERHRYLYLWHDPAVCALGYGAVVQWLLGHPERAIRREREASELARRLRHALSLAQALWLIGECQVARRDPTAVIATATELRALCEEHRMPQQRAQALVFLGWALARSGEVAEGTQRLAEGLDVWTRLGARTYLPCGICLLAESYLLGRQYAEGLEQVALGLAAAAEIGEKWYLARLHHLRAELLQAQGRNADAAEASLRTAVDIARAQGARGWELRAATSLAQLWRDQGKRGEAHDLLGPVYGWFTEGFDTPDLQDAKALLDQLA